MGGAPQGAMRVASQIWQVVFASQTLQVFCLAFRKKAQYVVVNAYMDDTNDVKCYIDKGLKATCQITSYPPYVKDIDLDVHVQMFKTTIQTNGEIKDEDIVHMSIFTLHDTILKYKQNFLAKCSNYNFAKLEQTFYNWVKYMKTSIHAIEDVQIKPHGKNGGLL